MWFPYILNNVVEFMNTHPGEKRFICDIVYAKNAELVEAARSNFSSTVSEQCIEMLEISTYHHSLVLEVMYAVGFATIGVIINSVGKKYILCKFS